MVLLKIPINRADLPSEMIVNKTFEECMNEAINEMASYGLHVSNIVIGNGITRFSTHDKKKRDKSGWYWFDYEDGVLFGAFGCFRDLETITFTSKSYKALDASKRHEINMRIKARKEEQENKLRLDQELVAGEAQKLFTANSDAPTFDYSIKKKVPIYANTKILENVLYIPLFDYTGKLWNYQKIFVDGSKYYFKPFEDKSGRKKGCFYPIDGKDDIVLICEGYATGATLFEQTGQTTICAMDCANIIEVASALRGNPRFTQSQFIVCADNDHDKKRIQSFKDAGLTVKEAPDSERSGYDYNDYYLDGGNVKEWLFPSQDDEWIVDAESLCMDLSPPDYIIDDIIPANSLGMMHGPSGHGKTFVSLDMAYHISNRSEWHLDKVIEGGQVLYLAGEGHNGLKYRLLALKRKYGKDLSNIFLSKSGTDLNTVDGLNLALQTIRKVDINPRIIFVDTLHRFLDGDENSAKDAKGMIEACDILKNEFNCTVILVHHTGLSEGTQERARGSSAWRGAMDFEYNVRKNGEKLVMSCKKMKEGEEFKPIIFDFPTVELEGIFKKTGEVVTTKLVALCKDQEPPKPKNKDGKDGKLAENTQLAQSIWREGGAKIENGRAYFYTKDVIFYAETFLEYSKEKARHMTKTAPNKFIGSLIEGGVLEKLQLEGEPTFFFKDPAINFATINSVKEVAEMDIDVPF